MVDAALDQQRHAVPALELGRPRHLARGDEGAGPFSVFPLVRHAHRTTGFFKVRGINLNHAEFEDFMFRNEGVADFKAELIERARSRRAAALDRAAARRRAGRWRTACTSRCGTRSGSRPEVAVLEAGTLAREFEASVKTPRFVDRRQ